MWTSVLEDEEQIKQIKPPLWLEPRLALLPFAAHMHFLPVQCPLLVGTWINTWTHTLNCMGGGPKPPADLELGNSGVLRPGVQSSFSPHVAHSDEDPIKLPPDSGALHHPSCKPCIPSHQGGAGCASPCPLGSQHGAAPCLKDFTICLLIQAPAPAPGRSKDSRRGGLTTPLSLALPLPFFLFLLAGRQPILFIALNSRVIR